MLLLESAMALMRGKVLRGLTTDEEHQKSNRLQMPQPRAALPFILPPPHGLSAPTMRLDDPHTLVQNTFRRDFECRQQQHHRHHHHHHRRHAKKNQILKKGATTFN